MKTALIGGGIFAAAYVAAGMLYAKKRPAGAVRVNKLEGVALWPLVLWNDRKNARVADGGATLKDAARSALAGTTAGVEIRR